MKIQLTELTLTSLTALTLAAGCVAEPEDTKPTDGDELAGPLKQIGHVPGDLDWDGDSDLLFQRRTDYAMKVWGMAGNVHAESMQTNPIGPVDQGWAVAGTPDLGDDGRPDILFQNENSKRLVSWWMVDLERTFGGFTNPMGPSNALAPRGACDVDGDELHDIVFQDNSNDKVKAWRMSGMTRLAEIVYASPPIGYTLYGCSDFSGDDLGDLVFLNNDLEVEIWENDFDNGNGWVIHTLGAPPSDPDLWRLGAIGDYNGDGHHDLVFQGPWIAQGPNATANTPMVVWYLHYYTPVGQARIREPDGSTSYPGDYWQLVGPR
jgi:hypothetical protein